MKFIPSVLLSTSILTLSAAAGDQPFEIIDLGHLGGGESVAYGLNDNGAVVGWSTLANCFTATGAPCRRAFIWENGVMTDLGKLPADEESFARAINNSGQIVGTSESDIIAGSGVFHGVTWDKSGITALADLGSGQSFAHDINEAGTIAGHSQDPKVDQDRAVFWSAGSIFNLGDNEGHQYNRANGLNDAAEMVGFAWNLFQAGDSIKNSGGKWSVIGGIDSPWQNSEATDLNNAGVVVGFQAFPQGDWHGAYWKVGDKGATDAGLLPGTDASELYDVNEAGLAVGRSYGYDAPYISRAMSFDGKTLVDLNDLLPANFDGVLYEAREVNEFGAIAGTAEVNGKFHAILMQPQASWTQLGGGLAGKSGEPVLTGYGDLSGGSVGALQVTEAAQSSPMILVAGFTQANAPVLGGLLVPEPDYLFDIMFTDTAGEAEANFVWPTGVPAGVETFWQAWVLDSSGPQGFTATKAVTQSSH